MDPIDNERRTAEELVLYAKRQGVDLAPLCSEGSFAHDRRWICLWRKLYELPCSRRADEKEGTLHYSMQGTIVAYPSCMSKDSISAFRGSWSEAGILEGMEEAFQLVKAWLLDGAEVDNLPERAIRRAGI